VPLSLDGPWAKVDRAVEDLKALNLGCEVFLKSKPYYVTSKFEAEAGCHVIRLGIREGVPLALAVVVGGIVHHLRSALEHAVWLIACRSHPVEKLWQDNIAEQIAFPFVQDPKKFPLHKLMPYIADDAKTVLDGLQPYQRDDRTAQALVQLNALWNIDKHRVLHGGFSQIDISALRFQQRGILIEQFEGARIEIVLPPDRIAEHGTPIALGHFGPLPPGVDPVAYAPAHSTKVDVKGEPTAKIFFGARGGGRGYGVEGIANLVGHTSDALGRIGTLAEAVSRSQSVT
jgi:hypothetical protein